MAKNPFRALSLPILAALCLAGCRALFNPQPTADPALAATQTAQRALLERIAATLTAIPSITPGGQAAQATPLRPAATPLPTPAGSAQRPSHRGRYGPVYVRPGSSSWLHNTTAIWKPTKCPSARCTWTLSDQPHPGDQRHVRALRVRRRLPVQCQR